MDKAILILVTVTLVGVSLAGCLGASAPNDTPDGDDPSGAGTSNRTLGGGNPGATSQGPRPHTHDFWKGRETIPVVDREVSIQAANTDTDGDGPLVERVGPNSCSGGTIDIAAWCLGRRRFVPEPWGDDLPKAVAPGTSHMTATATWSDETITGVELSAIAPDGREVHFGEVEDSGGTVRLLAEDVREPDPWGFDDEPGEVNLSMMYPLAVVDDGHADQSAWTFVMTATDGAFGSSLASVAHGSVHWKIEAHRANGSLPLEPPHPDWYANTDSYHVGFGEDSADNAFEVTYMSTDYGYVRIRPQNPVPPGTDEIVIRVKLTNDSPLGDQEQTSPRVRVFNSTDPSPFSGSGEEISPASQDGEVYIYRLKPRDRDLDSTYACTGEDSVWSFRAYVEPQPVVEDEPVLGADVPGVMHWSGKIEMSVATSNTPDVAWDDLEPSNAERVPGCDLVDTSWYGY